MDVFSTPEARSVYAGIELGDGNVLVCGGLNATTAGVLLYTSTCNRLSFDTTLHSQTFPLPEGRIAGTLSLVGPNRVLLAGGSDSNSQALTARLSSPFASWSVGQGIWGMPENLPAPRVDHTATRLDTSVVLIGG